VTTGRAGAVRLWDVLTDVETWHPTQLRAVPAPAPAPDFIEDEDLAPVTTFLSAPPRVSPVAAVELIVPVAPERVVHSAEDRLALMEKLEREALAKRFKELDRRSEEQAAEQQRVFAERLDAAITGELEHLRERRRSAVAELEQWTAAERQRVTGDLAAEEQRFADRLMRQLNEFEAQLGERLREQEQKLAGWWNEAERLADERMRGAIRDVNAA
jgi:hypothetical protein